MSDPASQDVPVVPANSAPPAKVPAKKSPSNPDVGPLLVKAAAVALTIGVGISLLKNKNVQQKVEEAKDGVSSTVEDVDYKVRISMTIYRRHNDVGAANDCRLCSKLKHARHRGLKMDASESQPWDELKI